MEQNLFALLQMMESSIPAISVTQSLHAQAMRDTKLRQVDALQSMTQVMGVAEQTYRAMLPALQSILPSEIFTGTH